MFQKSFSLISLYKKNLLFFSVIIVAFVCNRNNSKTYSENETSTNVLSKPLFTQKDKQREKIYVKLLNVGKGFQELTDMQFFPNSKDLAFVLEKEGKVTQYNLKSKQKKQVLQLRVKTSSEMGLLGLAFHPKFTDNQKIYLHYNPAGSKLTRIAEFLYLPKQHKMVYKKTILEVRQPYTNHNGGQIVFGKDGYLYIGLGDGGWAGDPKNNGQKKKSLLGKILRIDVNGKNKKYSIPPDNPFAQKSQYAPEIYAMGLRNPWKFSFTNNQQALIVADVGQNKIEEISIVQKGKNYGWRAKEGSYCYDKKMCYLKNKSYVDPIYEYNRQDGGSITGGFIYNNEAIQKLKGKYIFGDFVSGRIWAIQISDTNKKINKAWALGKWPIYISSFARDALGNIYILDYTGGSIYKIIAS